MTLPVYSTGTVSITNHGTDVVGAGSMWSGINAREGDYLVRADGVAIITEVTDATTLKITPWPGATVAGGTYSIVQNYNGRVVGVAAAEDVGDMLEKLHVDGLPFIVGPDETVPDPSYGDEGQLAFKPDTGKWWQKTGGAWVSIAAPGAGSGNVAGPTPPTITDDIATFADTTGKLIKDGGKKISDLAPIVSPTFTGDPKAPTAALGDNDTSIATTAFVRQNAVYNVETVSTDLNTIVAGGFYFIEANCTNQPVAGIQYYLLVQKYPQGTGYVQQTAWNLTQSGGVWRRNQSAGGWGGWQRCADVADLTPPATVAPLINGTAAVGVATKYAREDHVHPTDTSRAALASPTFTGDPKAPTAAPGDNDTSIATTAFVTAAVTAGGGGGGGRPVLTANRSYFTDTVNGNDANNGLAAGAGNAFKTIGKMMAVVGALDTASFQLTCNAAAGTYTENVTLPKMVGALGPIFQGVGSTTIIQNTGTNTTAVLNDGAGVWTVQNMKLIGNASSGGNCMLATNGGVIKMGACEFGACGSGGNQIYVTAYGAVLFIAPYTISGGGQCHMTVNAGSINTNGTNGLATVVGSIAFTFAFALSNRVGLINALGYSATGGTVTGPRYVVGVNSVIDTGGGGASVFPGTIAGTPAPGVAGTTGRAIRMSKEYNAANWYWTVAENASEVYSSKLGDYVGTDDADFAKWGEDGTTPTQIDTEQNLGGVLYAYRLRPIPQGVLDGYLDTQVDQLMTEPDVPLWQETFAAGKSVDELRAILRKKLK